MEQREFIDHLRILFECNLDRSQEI